MKACIRLIVESAQGQVREQLPDRLVVELDGQYRGYVALTATPSVVHCGLILAGYEVVSHASSWGKPTVLDLDTMRSLADSCHVDESVKGEAGRIELLEKYLVGIDYRIDIFLNGRGQWELADPEMNLSTLFQILRISGFDVSTEERATQLVEPDNLLAA